MYFRNLGAFIKSKVDDVPAFAEAMQLSIKDVGRLFDGRLYPSIDAVKHIAKIINIDVDELINQEHDDPIRYDGKFSNNVNKEMLLEYIDRYCDLAENVKE